MEDDRGKQPFFSLLPSLIHLLMTHQLSKSCLNARQRLSAGLANDMQYIEDEMIAQSSSDFYCITNAGPPREKAGF